MLPACWSWQPTKTNLEGPIIRTANLHPEAQAPAVRASSSLNRLSFASMSASGMKSRLRLLAVLQLIHLGDHQDQESTTIFSFAEHRHVACSLEFGRVLRALDQARRSRQKVDADVNVFTDPEKRPLEERAEVYL